MWPMAATEFIKARLSTELKERARLLAERQLLSESAWLKNLVVRELRTAEEGAGAGAADVANPPTQESDRRRGKEPSRRRRGRVYVRLRRED